jgi:hypothetical protein
VDPELVCANLLTSVPLPILALLKPGGYHNGCRCWLWDGRLNRSGHARVHWRRPVLHRELWELLVGPIPDGLVLDHLCRVRRCVNPLHLEPVTNRINTLRGEAVLFRAVATNKERVSS